MEQGPVDRGASLRPRLPFVHCASCLTSVNDTPPLLHRRVPAATSPPVVTEVARRRTAARPSCSIARRSIRRPAVSHSTPACSAACGSTRCRSRGRPHRALSWRRRSRRERRCMAQIDWARRFDHMQQHTGQHVLSAAFDRVHRARTESFHLGVRDVHDRLRRDAVAPTRSPRPSRKRTGSSGRTVRCACGSCPRTEAASLPLRKEPARGGRCGSSRWTGTICPRAAARTWPRTGAVGIIAVTGFERFKGGTRVEFVCGGRALARFRQQRDVIARRASPVGRARGPAGRDRAAAGRHQGTEAGRARPAAAAGALRGRVRTRGSIRGRRACAWSPNGSTGGTHRG